MKRERQRQFHILLLILGIISLLAAGASFLGSSGGNNISADITNVFDDTWVLSDSVNGDRVFHAPDRVSKKSGEPVVLTNRLPEEMAENTVLMVETSFQHFTVKIEDTVIYECGSEDGHTLGKEPFPACYMIPLPTGYAGNKISLEITSDYSIYSGRIGSLSYGVRGDVLLHYILPRCLGLLGGCVLLVLACLLFIMKIAIDPYGKRQYELSYLGIMMAMFGVFMLCDSGILSLFFKGTQGIWVTRLLVLLMLPFFYLLYLYNIVDKRKVSRFLGYGIAVFLVNYVTAFVLALLGLCDVVVCSYIAVCVILVVLFFVTFILLMGGKTFEKRDLTYHGISNIVFYTFLILSCVTRNAETLGRYSGMFFVIGVLLWCFLLLFHTEGRVADTLYGERLLQQRVLKEYKQQALFHLNPDRVFGGLHTLLDMMKQQDPQAPHYLVEISNYLRGRFNMLRYDEDTMIPFEEELTHIQGGLELALQKDKNFHYEMEIKIKDFAVPAFSIQAFTENAVTHGAGTIDQPTSISVKTYETEKAYGIQIIDTGCGFDPDQVKSGDSYGISQTVGRLERLASASVDIRSREGKGTVVTIKIPKSV